MFELLDNTLLSAIIW